MSKIVRFKVDVRGIAEMQIKDGDSIYIDTTACSLISGVDGYLSAYLTNNISVWVSADIYATYGHVYVTLINEGVRFVAKKVAQMHK
jgi:hypothetical protein